MSFISINDLSSIKPEIPSLSTQKKIAKINGLLNKEQLLIKNLSELRHNLVKAAKIRHLTIKFCKNILKLCFIEIWQKGSALITFAEEEDIKTEGITIKIVPAFKFLLSHVDY